MHKLIEDINESLKKKIFNTKNINEKFEKLGLDSLDIMTLILFVQEKYKIKEISDSDFDSFKSLNDIINFLITKKIIKK